MLLYEGLDLMVGKECKGLDPLFRVDVGRFEPELVELIWGGLCRVQPDVPFFRLAKFRAVGFGHQGTGEGERFATSLATDELGTGGDIPPLVASTHLQLSVLIRI